MDKIKVTINVIEAKRVKDAHGALCLDCGAVFNLEENPYWHWKKSQAMHARGTGHKTVMYTIV